MSNKFKFGTILVPIYKINQIFYRVMILIQFLIILFNYLNIAKKEKLLI